MNATHPVSMRFPGSEITTLALQRPSRDESRHQPDKQYSTNAVPAPTEPPAGVEFRPAGSATRQTAAWRGFSGEVVRISNRKAFECEYHGPSHLLIAYHRAVRHNGDTVLDDVPKSTRHDLSRKLTFVPAGSRFREQLEGPSGQVQVTYLYIDPRGPLMDSELGSSTVELPPRMLFEDRALWETSLKLTQLIEAGPSACCCYAEALGVVLAHELLLLQNGGNLAGPALQGGLAHWQQRAVAQYIEEHLDSSISLTKLAGIARLSPYHFSRAFKKSFGLSPRRYHMCCRLDWAKRLLAKPSVSVTDIALKVGFADTSSFSVAFRKLVGQSPREYRRGLV